MARSSRNKAPDAKSVDKAVDAELDRALEATFPASDAFSVGQSSVGPRRPVHRRPPLIDEWQVRRLAERLSRRHPDAK